MINIHPTAIIGKKVELGDGVEVGPYAVIEGEIKIGRGTKISSHAVIAGFTTIGENCRIFTGAVIGSQSQDLKYKGEESFVKVGNKNIIREYVTINRATGEGNTTFVGDGNLIMAYAHVAHNCRVYNGAILANEVTLAGHVDVENKAIIGGVSAIHQFVTIGELSIIGGCSKVVKDIIPFARADGHPTQIYGINNIGLLRSNFSQERIDTLKKIFKILFRSNLNTSQAVVRIKKEFGNFKDVEHLIGFIEKSKRGICK